MDVYIASAEDFSISGKRAGRLLGRQPYGLKFYSVNDCLCGGEDGQLVFPAAGIKDGKAVCLAESFNYEHPAKQIKDIASRFFAMQGTTMLDQAVPMFPLWGVNFYHWMLECLPRILVLERLFRYTGAYIVSSEYSFTEETLRMIGVSPDRIFYNDKRYHVRSVLLPASFTASQLLENQELLAFLRSELLSCIKVKDGCRRVYVKRTGRRIVRNDDEVIDLLGKYDFEVLVPEELGCAEQFSYMTDVSLSVMPHGANAVLALFQKPQTGLIEFFNRAYITYTTMPIVRLQRLRYVPFVEQFTAQSVDFAGTIDQRIAEDITVDTRLLQVLLETFGVD